MATEAPVGSDGTTVFNLFRPFANDIKNKKTSTAKDQALLGYEARTETEEVEEVAALVRDLIVA